MVRRKPRKPKSKSDRATKRGLPDHLRARQRKLRSRMRQLELDALLISSPKDIRYFTGWPGEDSCALVTSRRLFVISDSRYEEQLDSIKSWAQIVMRKTGLIARVGELVAELRLGRVGVQPEYWSALDRKALSRAVPGRKLRDHAGLVADLRIIKDEVEVAAISKAVHIQQEALRATLAGMKLGETEAQFAARLEYEIKMCGAEGSSFEPIVAAQANGSMPHYTPSPKARLTRNTPLLIDWGARFDGYCGDLTRTFALGRFPKQIRQVYDIVLEAQLAAISAIKPGAKLRDVDAAARAIIADAGHGAHFGHGLGHGIGLDVHEAPSLSPRAGKRDELKTGMVVTVEPGIYLPGVGGVRIEDDVLVTARGHRVLSDFPKDAESAIVGWA